MEHAEVFEMSDTGGVRRLRTLSMEEERMEPNMTLSRIRDDDRSRVGDDSSPGSHWQVNRCHTALLMSGFKILTAAEAAPCKWLHAPAAHRI